MTFDYNKPICTKAGLPARFLAFINNESFPLVVVVEHKDGDNVQQYTAEGTKFKTRPDGDWDLTNVPEITEQFLHIEGTTQTMRVVMDGDKVTSTEMVK